MCMLFSVMNENRKTFKMCVVRFQYSMRPPKVNRSVSLGLAFEPVLVFFMLGRVKMHSLCVRVLECMRACVRASISFSCRCPRVLSLCGVGYVSKHTGVIYSVDTCTEGFGKDKVRYGLQHLTEHSGMVRYGLETVPDTSVNSIRPPKIPGHRYTLANAPLRSGFSVNMSVLLFWFVRWPVSHAFFGGGMCP